MAKTNLRVTSTTKLDREYDDNLLDMIDKKLQNSTEPAVKSAMKKFDNSHSTERLNEVYDELDMEQFMTHSRDSIPVINTRKPKPLNTIATSAQGKIKKISNPFIVPEKKEETHQATYSDIVTVPKTAPTIEIKSYTPVRPAKQSLSKRLKLWLATGICCLVLLCGVIVVSALNLGMSAGGNVGGDNAIGVETGQLADEQGIVNNTGRDLTAEELESLNNGTLSPDIAYKVPSTTNTLTQQTNPSSNLWDQICAFFARLFGR